MNKFMIRLASLLALLAILVFFSVPHSLGAMVVFSLLIYFLLLTRRLPDGRLATCPSPFDALRLRVEYLGPRLYQRATWLDPWLNLIPRGEWPVGAGLVQSSFEIGRSEPTTEEETWTAITTTSGSSFIGSCIQSWTDTEVGYQERQYNPEAFWLRGPLVCQTDLTLHFQSVDFWNKYFMRLEQRNTRTIVNRLQNVYGSFASKVTGNANGSVTVTAGNVQPQPGSVFDLTNVPVPSCGLDQSLLDSQVSGQVLAGATSEDSGGWITNLGSGPVFPLLIGIDASNQLALNNPDLREDLRSSYQGYGDTAEVLLRLGASRVIKNYRHVITATPPRWGINDSGVMYRISPWQMIPGNQTTGYGKGQVAIPNPAYLNPNIAVVEAAIVLSKWNIEEQVLRPVNAVNGQRWSPKDYYGQWVFVTGNDALLGMTNPADSTTCAGLSDPFHEYGRHFAQYKHGFKPVYPDFAQVFLFLRCPATTSCLTCS